MPEKSKQNLVESKFEKDTKVNAVHPGDFSELGSVNLDIDEILVRLSGTV